MPLPLSAGEFDLVDSPDAKSAPSLSEGEFEMVGEQPTPKIPSRADMEKAAPAGGIRTELPTDLKSDAQLAASAPTRVNPRTGRVYRETPPGQSLLDFPLTGTQKIVEGAEALASPLEHAAQDVGNREAARANAVKTGKYDVPQTVSGEKDLRDAARGVTKIASGAFDLSTPLLMASGVQAPVGTVISLGAGALSQMATEKALKALDVPEEYAGLAGVIAGAAGASVGAVASYMKNAAFRAMVRRVLQNRLNTEFAQGERSARQAREATETGPEATPKLEGQTATPPAEDIQEAETEPVPTAAPADLKPGEFDVTEKTAAAPEPVEAEPVEPTAPAETPKGLTVGAEFQTANGKFTIGKVEGGKITFVKETARGKFPGTLPVDRFSKLVGYTPEPEQTPQTPQTPQVQPEAAPVVEAEQKPAEPVVAASEPETSPEAVAAPVVLSEGEFEEVPAVSGQASDHASVSQSEALGAIDVARGGPLAGDGKVVSSLAGVPELAPALEENSGAVLGDGAGNLGALGLGEKGAQDLDSSRDIVSGINSPSPSAGTLAGNTPTTDGLEESGKDERGSSVSGTLGNGEANAVPSREPGAALAIEQASGPSNLGNGSHGVPSIKPPAPVRRTDSQLVKAAKEHAQSQGDDKTIAEISAMDPKKLKPAQRGFLNTYLDSAAKPAETAEPVEKKKPEADEAEAPAEGESPSPNVEIQQYRGKGSGKLDRIDVYIRNVPGKGWAVRGDFTLQGLAGGHLADSGHNRYYPTREEALGVFLDQARSRNNLTQELGGYSNDKLKARQEKMVRWLEGLAPKPAPEGSKAVTFDPKTDFFDRFKARDTDGRPLPTENNFTYFTGKSSADVAKMARSRSDMGLMISPRLKQYLAHIQHYPVVTIDNGAFYAEPTSAEEFDKFLTDVAAHPEAQKKVFFVVAPDVVGDAKATIEKFPTWEPMIHGHGLPVAFVAQDGVENMLDEIPWDKFEVLFIGGSTEWKIGKFSDPKEMDPQKNLTTSRQEKQWRELFKAARAHKKPVHFGRVNSYVRAEIVSYGLGEASADGTYLAYGPEKNLPQLTNWLDRLNNQNDSHVPAAEQKPEEKPSTPVEEPTTPVVAEEPASAKTPDNISPETQEPEAKAEPAVEELPAPNNVTGARGLADAVYQKLKAGKPLGNVTELNKLAEQHFGASRTSGEWTPKDAFDAMEAGVNKFLLDRGADLMKMPAIDGLKELRSLMARLTTQGVRTEEQIKNQQFSTPPTEAYVAAKVAGIQPGDVFLEPSAGNGGLAVWAKAVGAKVFVNEIAPRRQDMLEHVGFGKPSAHDGELIHPLLDLSVKPTVIVMNPPFSASTTKSHEAKNNNTYGFNHVQSALQRLQPGGRLVAILGGGQANEPDGGASLSGTKSGRWFRTIGNRYNVRANVRVNGKEYAKYGTSFATRIIVIDKDGPTNWAKVVKGNADTLEEAYGLLQSVADSRPAAQQPDEVQVGPRSTGSTRESEPRTGVEPTAESVERGDGSEPAGQPDDSGSGELPDQPSGSSGEHDGLQPNPGGGRVPLREPDVQPGQRDAAEPVAGAGSDPEHDDEQRPLGNAEEPADQRLALERNVHDRAEQEDTDAYVAYRPTLKGPEHPGAIVETKTMATVPLPEITYKPSLPQSVLQGAISGVQLEAIALAGQQNSIVLPGGFRASALIGDGTGVGKGRISAGILWDNWRQGRKRLVWVSEKNDLMQDAARDLTGIGATDLLNGVTKLPDGKFAFGRTGKFRSLASWDAKDTVAHEGVLFTTYSLIRSEDKKGNRRADQLQRWLKGNDDGDGAFILFDESHNLKNAVPSQGSPASKTGTDVKRLMMETPGLRSVSLSATAATEVNNLGYLDRLGLWGPGTSFPGGFNEFQTEIGNGRMAAMEMVARELKSLGKYISRTLSFKGVTYDQAEHEVTADQKAIYRTASKAWRKVMDKAEATIKETTNGGALQRSRFMSAFYGAQLRFFGVLVTTLKIPTAVHLAEKALAENKSVVITLVNTNEAAQNREKNRARDAADQGDEDEAPDYDFGPKEMLVNLVKENYPVQQFADDVDENNRPIKVPVYRIDEEGRRIPVNNPEAEAERDALIDEINRDLHMPSNPLDILIDSLGGSSKVAELTGRKERFDEASGKFIARGDPGTARKDINVAEMAKFQSGKKRVAVLSSAAGTGISLHADKGAKNQQKRYHLTLQVGWSADKQMQMFGRTNRTNQAHPPEYVMLASDLGGEKRFISTIARRLGSLGALTKGQKNASTGSDAMEKVNFETEQGRKATQAFYEALLRDQPVPGTNLTGMQVLDDLAVLKTDPKTGKRTVPEAERTNITRTLNRLLALDPDIQNAVYNFFYDLFEATVQQAVEDGTLDTGVKSLPGDEFKVKEERLISTDPKTGAKTFYYPVDAKVRMERVSVKDLEKKIASHRQENPRLLKNEKTGKIVLAVDAAPIVSADGRTTEAVRIINPGYGRFVKRKLHEMNGYRPVDEIAAEAIKSAEKNVTEAERSLQYAEETKARYTERGLTIPSWMTGNVETAQTRLEAAKAAAAAAKEMHADPQAAAREEWEKQYDAAPSHSTEEFHLIGGAVLRYWNAIKEASPLLDIYTTVDSKTGQRVVGVSVQKSSVSGLIARMSGGEQIVTSHQLINDVLINGTQFSLEGGITIRRGRVARTQVIQLVTQNPGIIRQLNGMGVLSERGIQPIHYVPTAAKGQAEIVDKILKEYPVVKDESQTGGEEPASEAADSSVEPKKPFGSERGSAPMLMDFAQYLADKFGPAEGPKANYSGLGGLKRIFLPGRNLEQVKQASKAVYTAALAAGSSESQASVILANAMPAIRDALKGSNRDINQLMLAYVESRLRGLKDRWNKFADDALDESDESLEESIYASAGSGVSAHLGLLGSIEGRHGIAQDLAQTAAAIAEDGDWETLRAFLNQAYTDAADRVINVMEPDEFDAISDEIANDPKVKRAHEIYKDRVEGEMARSHALNEGVFSEALGPLDTYYPLMAPGHETAQPPGRRLPFTKPRNQQNAFATGIATDYSVDMAEFSKRLSRALRANDKAKLISTMRETGWAADEPDGWDGGFLGPDNVMYGGVREESAPGRTIIKDGKAIHAPARFVVMPKFMHDGLRLVLGRQPMDANDVFKTVQWLNMLATKGPLELLYHSAGLMGALNSNTPFLGKSGLDKVLSAPIAKWFAIRGKIMAIDPTTPENIAKLQRIARVGALPAKSGKVTYSKEVAETTGAEHERFSFAPLLYGPKGIDARGRILMYDIALAANPKITDAELSEFINELGNYTPEFQGAFERAVKRIGVGPFATAGMTRIMNGVHASIGNGPMPKSGWKLRLLQQISGGLLVSLALWVIAYKELTGKWPSQDSRAKLWAFPVGHGEGALDKYRHSKLGDALWGKDDSKVGYLNFSLFNPLPARVTPKTAYTTAHAGGTAGQVVDAVQKDAMNTLAHPALGPAARAAFVGITGQEPYVTGLRERSGRPGLKLLPATPDKLKPGFMGGFAPSLASGTPRKNPGWSAQQGARASATLKELNSLGGEMGEVTGFLGADHGQPGNALLRTVFDLAFPGLIGTAGNPYASQTAIRQQRTGTQ